MLRPERNPNGSAAECLDAIKRWAATQSGRWWICLAASGILSLVTRLSYLRLPAGTTWDEVHFGKFANNYINRHFYHDVHPPLGKLFITAAAAATGYKGNFSFDVSTYFPEDVNYVAMRAIVGSVGSLLVPLSFLIVWELTSSLTSSCLAALCVLCDTFVHRITTLLLLDPPLLVAILTSVYGVTKFYLQREWSRQWWTWLSLTGLSLGAVMSIKYVGVFTVAYVGVHTALQLFCMCCDARRSLKEIVGHTASRALCLMGIPPLFYVGVFLIHIGLLTQWDPSGGGFYHTRFFGSYNNTEYDNETFLKHVPYGANVTLQNSRPMCGYLESWYDLFPSEFTAPCQQVTVSTIKDQEAVFWTAKKVDVSAGAVFDGSQPNEPVQWVRNGDHVMLTHTETGRSLRSHGHRAPVTKRLFQVCGYGDNGTGGPFETWEVVVPHKPVGELLRVFEDDFLLKHYKMNCFLRTHEAVKLPKTWTYQEAKEVACTKNVNHPGVFWHVNWVQTKRLNGTERLKDHAMGLLENFFYNHKAMFLGNAGLIPTEEELAESARPWMWPLQVRLQLLSNYQLNGTGNSSVMRNGTGADEYGGYIAIAMHNPVLAYLNVICLLVLPVLLLLHNLWALRCETELPQSVAERSSLLKTCGWLSFCWAAHYLPFFFMSRILYTHHYCPSFILSCMITGVILTYFCRRISAFFPEIHREKVFKACYGAVAILLVMTYIIFFPLATYIRGEFGEENTMRKAVEKVHLGQRWYEFGFKVDRFQYTVTTKSSPLAPGVLENPHLNATLYYLFFNNANLGAKKDSIQPFAASNYSSFEPQVQTNLTSYLDVFRMQTNSTFADTDLLELFMRKETMIILETFDKF